MKTGWDGSAVKVGSDPRSELLRAYDTARPVDQAFLLRTAKGFARKAYLSSAVAAQPKARPALRLVRG